MNINCNEALICSHTYAWHIVLGLKAFDGNRYCCCCCQTGYCPYATQSLKNNVFNTLCLPLSPSSDTQGWFCSLHQRCSKRNHPWVSKDALSPFSSIYFSGNVPFHESVRIIFILKKVTPFLNIYHYDINKHRTTTV